MNFQFDLKTSVEESVKEIASQVIESAVFDCSSRELNDHEKIHSVRKSCKRIRALLRIVRPNIGSTYREENIFFRDLSRKLSDARDAQVIIDTIEKISVLTSNSSISKNIQALNAKLIQERDSIESSALLNEFNEEIKNTQTRITWWDIKGRGFKCLEGGLKKTYKRGQTAMYTSFKKPTAENYHEWRKRAKYHYHHLELLIPTWESLLKQHTEETRHLSELLGYDHDLSLLRDNIICNNKYNLSSEIKNQITSSIHGEQQELRLQIFKLGKKIYAEKPRCFLKRIKQYWKASKK